MQNYLQIPSSLKIRGSYAQRQYCLDTHDSGFEYFVKCINNVAQTTCLWMFLASFVQLKLLPLFFYDLHPFCSKLHIVTLTVILLYAFPLQ